VITLKLYYDGWLALPPATLQKLGVRAGEALEVELAEGGAILLRRAAKSAGEGQRQALAGDAAAHEADTVPGMPEQTSAPVKRRPGRPRKAAMAATPQPAAAADRQGELPEAGAHLGHEPTPSAGIGAQSELRRKIALPHPFLGHDPARGRSAERLFTDTGFEREERRPFRNVEVRKLGPGRRHNKAHKLAS
jgi:antitoxin component of MazEF toxin-antitoxin module